MDEAIPSVEHSSLLLSSPLPSSSHSQLTSDALPNSDVHALFAQMLKDTREIATKKEGPDGTFHGFGGKPGAARIDWIFVRGFTAVQNQTVTFHENGRYPSDHFPILALLEF